MPATERGRATVQNTGGAQEAPMLVEQGSDWPGYRVPMFTRTGAPFDPAACVAHGEIKARVPDEQVIFTWSSSPGPGEGSIELAGAVVWRLLAEHTADWSWTEGRYEINIYNPNGPEGDRHIRVAQGPVLVDPQLDRTPLP